MNKLTFLAAIMLLSGCNGSPTQASFRGSIFTFDNRTFYEIAGNATNEVSRPAGGHGSNSRIYSDGIQGLVLYKSPVSANSNSTPISVELPIR